MKRLLGRHTGHRRGPLVILIGAMHGNEAAGVAAIQELFQMLEKEPAVNAGFKMAGQVTGFIGNIAAYQAGKRFITTDLNRLWNLEHAHRLMAQDTDWGLHTEEQEMRALLHAIGQEVQEYRPETLVILDLHTTSASGGIFSIPMENDPMSIELAAALHAPVVMGLLDGLEGTFMHYVSHHQSLLRSIGRHIHTVAFEAGQHDDPLSVNRSISAIVHLLRAVGCIQPHDVDNHHEAILSRYASGLPKVTQIKHVHHIQPHEHFAMRPGYVNFQPVRAHEHLADSRFGAIYSPCDGFILMPLYQPQGTDGFFIVEEIPQLAQIQHPAYG